MTVRAALALAASALVLIGCLPVPEPESTRPGAPYVRVAVASRLQTVALAATGRWVLTDARGATVASGRSDGERWRVERRGSELRAANPAGEETPWRAGSLTLRSERGDFVRLDGKTYRGAIVITPGEGGLLAVNVLPLEEYLRGVVPIEIGPRTRAERAAIEAQAIAARSFTVTKMRGARNAPFDLVADVSDQAYGGVRVERAEADAAIRATAGRVLVAGGRVVDAPFHAACGGETAAAEEVWRTDGAPHLRRVSDRIPGSERYYCDIAPRFYWERRWTGRELDAVVARYLSAYARTPTGGPGDLRALRVAGRTASGRVAQLELVTATGRYSVRGNDARSVLRSAAGELLPSSYFSVTTEGGADGGLARIVVRGNGHGHGVGMCQWGAIGRARAGQSAQTILRVYYPGTTVSPIPSGYLTL